MGPELIIALVNLSARHLEADCFIWLGGKEQILELLIGWFNSLLIGRHEAMSWRQTVHDLRVINLEEEGLLFSVWTPLFSHFIAWSSFIFESNLFQTNSKQS